MRIPLATSWLPIPLSHIGSQVKRRQSQTYKFKKFAKISYFLILKRALHSTHPLKLLDKMCKYEMDPMSIVADTERTRFCPQTDRRTDRQTDKVIPVYPPFNFVEVGGIIIPMISLYCIQMWKWIVMNIFMWHISWSTLNAKVIAWPQQEKMMDYCWWPMLRKKSVFHGD